ncbi:branched-chain amino acid ABC transporter substrate-binding protein [Chryseobacterium kwangjuense]|uniref:Branched-chain amino acid ABC transporter substrate-binding protein n=1 Tax=Chryseobacterium kwangjuense TaxID=267125 RepID=A0ABW9K557_9FLAO
MAWDLFETVGNIIDGLDLLFRSLSSSDSGYTIRSAKKKRSKYFTEKVSACFIVAATVLLFFVFKDPLPAENYTQTLIVTSLIGAAASLILFFLLHVLELYYFKDLFRLLLFSGSVILFFIALVMIIYFRSGLFI